MTLIKIIINILSESSFPTLDFLGPRTLNFIRRGSINDSDREVFIHEEMKIFLGSQTSHDHFSTVPSENHNYKKTSIKLLVIKIPAKF